VRRDENRTIVSGQDLKWWYVDFIEVRYPKWWRCR